MNSLARSFTGLGATRSGQSAQVAKAFKGMAAEMEAKQVDAADCDEPQTIEQYRWLVASLQAKLADAQALIDEMRAVANSDAPAAAVTDGLISTADLAEKSGVSVSTICRHAEELGGIKMAGDWLFPASVTYGRKRKRK